MAIEGNLETFNLVNFLQFLMEEGRTGCLRLTRPGQEKRILFKQGKIVAAAGSERREWLLSYLERTGWPIERPGVQAILDEHVEKEGQFALGPRLVESGLVSEDEMHELLTEKVQHTVADVLGWAEGDFAFEVDEQFEFELVAEELDSHGIIFDAIQESEDLKGHREVLPSRYQTFILTDGIEPQSDLEGKILQMLIQNCTIDEICAAAAPSDGPVYEVLAGWAENGRILPAGERLPEGLEDVVVAEVYVPQEGDVIVDRYELIEELTRDGIGVTFEALDREDQELVDVKVVTPPEGEGKEFLRPLVDEVERVRFITHQSFIPVKDVGATTSFFYLVTDHVEGLRLSELMQLASFRDDLDRILDVVENVAGALAAAHGRGIFHGNLRPDQIVVPDEGPPLVGDFGLSTGAWDLELGIKEQHLGLPVYTAPELLDKGNRPAAATDVYSLAALLFEMVASRPPHLGDTAGAIHESHRTGEPPPSLSAARPEVPYGVEKAVSRALSRHPADRFPGVDRFLEALDADEPQDAVVLGEDAGAERPLRRLALVAVLLLAVGVPAIFLLGSVASSQRTVDELQETADKYYAVDQFVFPRGDNALETYRLILEIDPGNAHATERIATMQAYFVERARGSLDAGEAAAARLWLEKAARVEPSSGQVRDLRARIDEIESSAHDREEAEAMARASAS